MKRERLFNEKIDTVLNKKNELLKLSPSRLKLRSDYVYLLVY